LATFGRILEITEVEQTFGLLFSRLKSDALILTKDGLGFLWSQN
jgi:hypothetical protein